MRVEFSKEFEKAVRKLSGKMLDSVRQAVQEVINAGNIEELTDCKKLVDYEFIYRLRIGSYRAFFSYHVQIVDDCVMFLYLVPRGQAYDKKMEKNLQGKIYNKYHVQANSQPIKYFFPCMVNDSLTSKPYWLETSCHKRTH